jgi:glycosyltransferase involved in cell wall biosynthesis
LRILQVHNRYRPGWGGEDTVVELEADLLRRRGHYVDRLSLWTRELVGASRFRMVAAGLGTTWSWRGYREMTRAIDGFLPDVVHVHNTFPLLSPSIYWAAARKSVPVVQTLHNFRLTCSNAMLYRNNKPCEDCVGKVPFPALRHRCYHGSFFQTAAVCSMNVVHRCLGTYRTKVRAYIVLSEFARELMVRAGLPAERICIKSNFNSDPGKLNTIRQSAIVFVGDVSPAKGVHLLLEAWSRRPAPGHQLMIIGDGQSRAELEARYAADASVIWCGLQPRDRVLELVAASRWLVLPSRQYENCPMSVLEAFSVATPVIVPNHGPFRSIVTDGAEGLLFQPSSSDSLTEVLRKACQVATGEWTKYSETARATYKREYTEQRNYRQLIGVYEQAIQKFGAARFRADHRGPSERNLEPDSFQRQDA